MGEQEVGPPTEDPFPRPIANIFKWIILVVAWIGRRLFKKRGDDTA